MYPEVNSVLYLVTQYSYHEREKLQLTMVESRPTFPLKLKPTVFTIAELLRAARAGSISTLARDALLWGLQESVIYPLDLIRDAFFIFFSSC
jgi:hypothetical protein